MRSCFPEIAMRAVVRRFGHSAGIIIPKPMLEALDLPEGGPVEMTVAEGRLILMPVEPRHRRGWSAASRAIAEMGDDAPAWPEFADAGDDIITPRSWRDGGEFRDMGPKELLASAPLEDVDRPGDSEGDADS
jgi:antitoxin MazE